jgi:hypothetical protein
MRSVVFVTLLGLAGMGCAADVDDVVRPSPEPAGRPVASKTFSGTTETPVDESQVVVDWSRVTATTPPGQAMPGVPTPGSGGGE